MKEKILDVCCTNELDFKFDHFKDINELLEQIDIWFINDDIYYTRWFGLNDLHILKVYITNLQENNKKLNSIIDDIKNYINENGRICLNDTQWIQSKTPVSDLLDILNKEVK